MSTRGLYGIKKDGEIKATYNHWDSYPSNLGKNIVEFCSNNTIEQLNEFFDLIELVDEDTKPTDEQIKYCVDAGYYNEHVSNESTDDWYCLLHGLMGDFDEYQGLIDNFKHIYMIDNIDFIKDSLFCEYAYIINLDTEMLEFYEGFQKEPQDGNCFGEKPNDSGYYPCKLVSETPLDWTNDYYIDDFVTMMNNRLDSIEDVELFENLQKFSLNDEDRIAIIQDGKAEKVCGVYEDADDIGREWVENVYGDLPQWLDNDRYINYKAIGEDLIEYGDMFMELPSGKYAHLS